MSDLFDLTPNECLEAVVREADPILPNRAVPRAELPYTVGVPGIHFCPFRILTSLDERTFDYRAWVAHDDRRKPSGAELVLESITTRHDGPREYCRLQLGDVVDSIFDDQHLHVDRTTRSKRRRLDATELVAGLVARAEAAPGFAGGLEHDLAGRWCPSLRPQRRGGHKPPVHERLTTHKSKCRIYQEGWCGLPRGRLN